MKASLTRESNQQNLSTKKPFFGPRIFPKLTVNQPNDQYEQEADTIADRVMRIPFQRECHSCAQDKLQRYEKRPEDEKVQKKSQGSVASGMEAPSIVQDVINSGGQPLDTNTRKFFESRLGYDFSDVKIHTRSKAAASAQSVNALAYTYGNNIVFNENQFSPKTDSGKRLLAHELTHVVQQESAQSIQRQVTSFPQEEKEELPIQRATLHRNFHRAPKDVVQCRGGASVGSLCIRSNVVNQGLTDGHAWLSYTPTGSSETTYGTWGNRDPIGLYRDLEVGRPFAASRCTEVDSTDISALNSFASSNNTWTLTNNCSSFAARGWRHVTGEDIPHTTFFIPNPSALGEGIHTLGGTLSPTTVTDESSSSGNSF